MKQIQECPKCQNNISDPDFCHHCGWTSPIVQAQPSVASLLCAFVPSDWVVLYKSCGWIAIVIAILVIFQEQYMTAVYFVCMGLSAFLAAHILRLLEKGVHHLENLDKRGEQQAEVGVSIRSEHLKDTAKKT